MPAKTKTGTAKSKKIAKVMREFHAGTLRHGGSGEIVTSSQVAKAIAMRMGAKAEKSPKVVKVKK